MVVCRTRILCPEGSPSRCGQEHHWAHGQSKVQPGSIGWTETKCSIGVLLDLYQVSMGVSGINSFILQKLLAYYCHMRLGSHVPGGTQDPLYYSRVWQWVLPAIRYDPIPNSSWCCCLQRSVHPSVDIPLQAVTDPLPYWSCWMMSLLA